MTAMLMLAWGVLGACSDDGTASSSGLDSGTGGDSSESANPNDPSVATGVGEVGGESTSSPEGTGTAEGTSGGGSSTAASSGADESTGGTSEAEDTGSSGGGFDKGPGIYVRASDGLDGNPGTADAPKRTIRAGIEAAVAMGLPDVYVAAGDYLVDHDVGERVVAAPGVSLWGGFSDPQWAVRDPSVHVTRIDDVGVSSVGSWDEPTRALFVPADVGPDTTIDGFFVSAGSGTGGTTAAVIDGGPTVANNVFVNLATVAEDGTARAVLLRDSDAVVVDNVVEVTYGHAALMLDAGAATIAGNVIRASNAFAGVLCASGGQPAIVRNRVLVDSDYELGMAHECGGVIATNIVDAAGASGGIDLTGHAVVVAGNTVRVQTPDLPAWGVQLPDAELTMTNNIVVVAGSPFTRALNTFSSSGDGAIENNTLVAAIAAGCENVGCLDIPTLAGFEAAVPAASDNAAVPPIFIDADAGDFHLDDQTPCAVARGGQPLADPVGTTDIEGLDRTEPWSIGAHESDAVCP